MNKSYLIIMVVVAAAALYGGYFYGDKKGYDRGLADAVKIQAGKTGVRVDTGYKNPYEGVNLNPFK